jgi:hypothetical protein
MAIQPTIYVVASDANRNGKTLLARLVSDYLLLDGKDPFIFDTDAPDGPLRQFFPGRTALADFEKMAGRMKVFDTILGSPGRDYVIDLPQRHMLDFFKVVEELSFFPEAKAHGFRIIVFFVVDRPTTSLRMARAIYDTDGIDHFVAVTNDNVGTSWPEDEGSLNMPVLPRSVSVAISDRRFSLRNFVLGETHGLVGADKTLLNAFLFRIMDGLNSLDVDISLNRLRSR